MNQAERNYVEAARRSSREALEALGVRPYAYRWDRSHLAAEAVAAYHDGMGEDGPEVSVAGRLVSWRSQGKNKATAYKMLRAAIYQKKLEEQEAERAKLEATKTDISWGNQIRSYVFQPYTMVNDHRTELKVGDVHRVMDGDLDEFIEAFLKAHGGTAR